MKISYSQIEGYCNELHALSKNLKEIMNNIEEIGVQVSNNSWNSDAANVYSEKLKNATKIFDDIFIELETSILFLANSAEGYQAVDNNVVKEICSNLSINQPGVHKSKIFYGG